MSQGHKILFVCTGNTCRSYMAETIAKNYLNQLSPEVKLEIISAGTGCFAEEPASLQARTVMAEMGLVNDTHRAKRLTAAMVKEADLILAMTQRQRSDILKMVPEAEPKVFLLKEYALTPEKKQELAKLAAEYHNLDVLDPFGQPVEYYRACAQELAPLVSCTIHRFLEK